MYDNPDITGFQDMTEQYEGNKKDQVFPLNFNLPKYIIYIFQGFWDKLAAGMIANYTPSVTELGNRCREVWCSVAEHKKARLESKIKEANAIKMKKAKKGKGRMKTRH